jgi:nucleotide-binding universal stress UspA family protein
MTEDNPSTPAPAQPDATIAAGAIVVGVDGSTSSEQALRWAARQSRLAGRELHAVLAWGYAVHYTNEGFGEHGPETSARGTLEKTLEKALGEADASTVHQHVVEGYPVQVLLDASLGADMLVVGCRGRGGFAGMLLGSVSQHLVAHATVPVLVVR